MALMDQMAKINQLMTGVDALAALGARTSADPDQMDPGIAGRLDAVIAAAGFDVHDLAPEERAMVAGFVRTALAQAEELLERPSRGPGWAHTDPTVLQGQGRASASVVNLLAGVVGDASIGSFLDVGTGVGMISITAAQRWPDASVVGIDIWEPALQLAEKNVAEAGVSDRVEIRDQDVADLDESGSYDLAWLPTFFLPPELLETAVANVVEATKPGGTVVVGQWREPEDDLRRATVSLRTYRDGGAMHDETSILAAFEKAGLHARPLNDDMPGFPLMLVGGVRA